MFQFTVAWKEVWNLKYFWRQQGEANCLTFETHVRSTGVHLKFLALKISLTLICSGTEIASFYSHCTYLFTNSCYLISTSGKAPPQSHTDKPTTLYNSSIRSDEGINVRNGKTHTARDLHKTRNWAQYLWTWCQSVIPYDVPRDFGSGIAFGSKFQIPVPRHWGREMSAPRPCVRDPFHPLGSVYCTRHASLFKSNCTSYLFHVVSANVFRYSFLLDNCAFPRLRLLSSEYWTIIRLSSLPYCLFRCTLKQNKWQFIIGIFSANQIRHYCLRYFAINFLLSPFKRICRNHKYLTFPR